MAQYAVLSHPDVAIAGTGRRAEAKEWSPRKKLMCFIATGTACWAVVLAPFFLIG